MQFIGSALAAIGRRGTGGFALSILVGLCLPYFAAQARPLLPVSIFCFMVTTFLRADLGIIVGLIRRPGRLLLASLWLILAPMVLVYGLIAVGIAKNDPGLALGLAILGAAPPIMSAPAVAILYGFEPSLIIAAVLGITAVSPVVAPLVVDFLAGQAVPLDTSILMGRLLIFVGGGLMFAIALRRWLGRPRVAAMKAELDGFGVLMYFIFAVSVMDGVTEAALNQPLLVAKYLAIAFVLAGLGIGIGLASLRFTTPSDRFMLGYGAAQRNMGLLVAALGVGVPPNAFLFFALAQFPIYLTPWLLKPLATKIAAHMRKTTPSGTQ